MISSSTIYCLKRCIRLIGKGCAPCTGTEEKVLKLGKYEFEEDLEKSSLTVSIGDRENGQNGV